MLAFVTEAAESARGIGAFVRGRARRTDDGRKLRYGASARRRERANRKGPAESSVRQRPASDVVESRLHGVVEVVQAREGLQGAGNRRFAATCRVEQGDQRRVLESVACAGEGAEREARGFAERRAEREPRAECVL